MKKNSQRKLRQAWMRRARRAAEGNGYKFHRTSDVTYETIDLNTGKSTGNVTRQGKLYILKNDGRKVIEHKDDRGKISIEIKKA